MKTIGNIIWLICGGFMIAIEYFISGFVMLLTIIGIPFGIQHLKFALIALAPIGKTIVDKNTGQPLW